MDFDLVVLGSGPGGYVAAIRASQLGLSVACIEKEKNLGGTCLNIGCIPSKALLESSEKFIKIKNSSDEHGISFNNINLDLKKLMKRKDKIVNQLTSGIKFLFKKNKITEINGIASFIDKNTILVKSNNDEIRIKSKFIIIATGSKSIEVPAFKVDEKKILSSTGALSLQEIPESLLVVGGGYIGLEMGSVWSRLGTKVTVVEIMDHILPTVDREISNYFMNSLKKQGINFILENKVNEIKENKKGIEVSMESLKDKKKHKTIHSAALISIGRIACTEGLNLDNINIDLNENNTIKINKDFQTSVKNIYAIGDVVEGPMLAHKAEEEAVVCVEKILGQKPHVNYNTIPAVIYTKPEVAYVGKTEEQLKKENINYKSGKFPFSANGRALTTSTSEGFVKILADKKNDTILGAHIVGYDAGSLIAEIVAIMEFGGSAEDIARICHAHPTTSEALKEAALSVDGKAIHI